MLSVKTAQFFPAVEYIIGHQGCRLVAVEEDHLALVVADGDAQAVGVRVGSQHDVRPFAVSHFDGHLQGGGFFGVGGDYGREIAVVHILLGYVQHVFDAQTVEGFGHEPDTAAVERSVYKFNLVLLAGNAARRKHQRKDVVKVALVHFGAHHLDESGLHAGIGGKFDH